MNSTVHSEKSNICAKRIPNDLSRNRKLQRKTFSLSLSPVTLSPLLSLILAFSLNQSDRHIPRLLKFELKCLNIITRNLEFNNDFRYYQTISAPEELFQPLIEGLTTCDFCTDFEQFIEVLLVLHFVGLIMYFYETVNKI